jgi:transcriptional regulator of acetoin/glycerol metabolism
MRPRASIAPPAPLPATSNLRDLERDVIARAYERCRKNLSKTAKELGMPRSTLRRRLARYNIV